ncbi:MAG: acyl-CoA thioester hydrolase [Saprospiraceae bacterium]|uniref:acyl-CoA thioesterase n=1 Tax=Candidatus Marifrigoribacter sp. Uisw_064 TaxID=3230970 RepID=UPI003AECEC82
MNSEIFSREIIVPQSAIDARGHVNNLVYLEWCLEVAEAHWETKANTDLKKKFAWYVLHHSIDYKASVFEGEQLKVETWIANYKGAKCERLYKIIRLTDQKIIIEAKTDWCLVNANTLRPSKITEEISTLFV